LIIFSSIALTILIKNILKIKFSGIKNYLIKISYIVIIIFLFTIPLYLPENSNWVDMHDTAPTIFTGATYYAPTNDWLLALEWIKLNTPENAVIASWWDYGYWISTMSDRATIIDNATLETKTIQKMGKMFLSSPNDSWNILQEMGADYVVVFIAAEKINDNLDEKLYVLRGGGDESKVYPIAAISKMPLNKYYTSDGLSYSNYFFNETMMGKLIPFDTELYYNPQTFENSPTYKPGFMQIVGQKIDYNSDDDPLKLVYVSPSFIRETLGQMQVIVVYEVNKNYIP
jgi:dolichyl-diphosphooligosaccharide--protein glycosyltransferase